LYPNISESFGYNGDVARDDEKSSNSGCLSFGGLFWLANLIYTCMYWGGWAIFWNFFIPYALLWDLCTKFGPMVHGGQK
jgi:hypothetical protein